jgi:soluble lytic murein transglycosylase-like protein
MRMNRLTVIGLSLLFLIELSYSQIIVKQNKEGRITITNINAGFVSRRKSVKKTTVINTVPAYIYSRIKHFSKKYGVKKELILAVARAESGYNQFAKSKKGAVGIMQLMPETAKRYGVFNIYNIDENISAGIKHLRYLYKKYNKDIVLALAAYNAGENAVEKYNGVPPYRETKNYIKKIFNFMNKPLGSLSFVSTVNSKLYRYRTRDGRIVITDRYPKNIKKEKISTIRK